jgi:hypothetical protein
MEFQERCARETVKTISRSKRGVLGLDDSTPSPHTESLRIGRVGVVGEEKKNDGCRSKTTTTGFEPARDYSQEISSLTP